MDKPKDEESEKAPEKSDAQKQLDEFRKTGVAYLNPKDKDFDFRKAGPPSYENDFYKFLKLIDSYDWTFAKSRPETPHWYIIKNWLKEEDVPTFEGFVHFIREKGLKRVFQDKIYTYYNVGDYDYWTMGEPIEKTVVLNRAKKVVMTALEKLQSIPEHLMPDDDHPFRESILTEEEEDEAARELLAKYPDKVQKLSLYNQERPNIKISMELYFNEKNKLFFEGYDIGKIVDEVFGDSDYEYTYTIEEEETKKFYPLFGLSVGDKSGLLKAIQKQFSGNSAYSLFGDFMKENNIKYDSFSWT